MPSSRRARSVAVVCWHRVLKCQEVVHCSTIPRATNRIDAPLLAPLLTAVQPPPPCRRGRGCLINKWLLQMHSVVGRSVVRAALKQQALK